MTGSSGAVPEHKWSTTRAWFVTVEQATAIESGCDPATVGAEPIPECNATTCSRCHVRFIDGPDVPCRPRLISALKRVGRNDPCPCGAGRKFKQCHGRGA
jgi:uncharacterized protein YecA (UPF0149 family)